MLHVQCTFVWSVCSQYFSYYLAGPVHLHVPEVCYYLVHLHVPEVYYYLVHLHVPEVCYYPVHLHVPEVCYYPVHLHVHVPEVCFGDWFSPGFLLLNVSSKLALM